MAALFLLGVAFFAGSVVGVVWALAMAKLDPVSFARLQLHFAVLIWKWQKRFKR